MNVAIEILIAFVIVMLFAAADFYLGYRYGTDKYMDIQQAATIKAQNSVINKAQASAIINTEVGSDYDKQSEILINNWRATNIGMQPPAAGSMPAISSTAKPANAAASERRLNIEIANKQLCYIALKDLQNWIKQQAAIYNK